MTPTPAPIPRAQAEKHNACCEINQTPKWKRRFREMVHEVKFQIKLFVWHRHLYRPVMKLAHRYGWHYAPPLNPPSENPDERNHWCQWCGMRGTTFVGTKTPAARQALSEP